MSRIWSTFLLLAGRLGDPGHHRHRVFRARRSGARHERLRVRRRGRRLARPAGRRSPDPGAQLALDLLRQPAHRHRHHPARPGPHPGRPRPRTERRSGLARLNPRHRVTDDRRLRDRAGHQSWLGLDSDARLRRAGDRADGRLPRPRGANRQPDHAPAHPAGAQPHRLERGTRVSQHRDVLDVLSRHAVPRARAALQRAADRPGLHALDGDRRSPSAPRASPPGSSPRSSS